MRVGSFVSVLFAASLLGGVALADRPAEDGGHRSRIVHPREMRMREAREPREARTRETVTRVHDSKLNERFRARGEVHERYGSRAAAAQSKADAGAASIKAQRDADKALHRLTDRAKSVQNCSPTDDTCHSSRVAKTTDKADQARQQARENKQADEIRKMRDQIRAEKLKAIVFKKLCEKNADMCAENL